MANHQATRTSGGLGRSLRVLTRPFSRPPPCVSQWGRPGIGPVARCQRLYASDRYVRIRTYTRIHVCADVYAAYSRSHVFVFTCIRMYMHVYACIRMYTRTRVYMRICVYAYATYTRIHVCACIRVYVYVYTYTRHIRAYMYAHVYGYTYTRIRIRDIYAHTCVYV